MDRLHKAASFRERAKEFRKLAFGLQSGHSREALLTMADEYERMAERIENANRPA